MGLAPTAVETPDGRPFILNWHPNFFVKAGYRAADVRLSPSVPAAANPEIIAEPANVVYFIADSVPR